MVSAHGNSSLPGRYSSSYYRKSPQVKNKKTYLESQDTSETSPSLVFLELQSNHKPDCCYHNVHFFFFFFWSADFSALFYWAASHSACSHDSILLTDILVGCSFGHSKWWSCHILFHIDSPNDFLARVLVFVAFFLMFPLFVYTLEAIVSLPHPC